MRKWALLTIVLLFTAISAQSVRAQDTGGRLEVFGGYSYGQWDAGTMQTQNKHFALSGWEASATLNLNRFVGVVADFSGYAGTGSIIVQPSPPPAEYAFHQRLNTFMIGPEVGVHIGRIRPFAHVLFGATRSHEYDMNFATDVNGNAVREDIKQTRPSYAFGGGLDVNLTPHVSLRALQLDWIRNNFTDVSQIDFTTLIAGRQNNVRASAGIIFRFGVK
jgi:opacity protein-like surface antigen